MLLSATWPPARTSSRWTASASSVSARVSSSASSLSIRISSRSIGSARQFASSPSSGTGKTSSGGGKPVSRRRVSTLAARRSSAVISRPSLAVRAAKTASSVGSQSRKGARVRIRRRYKAVVATCSRGIIGSVDSVNWRRQATTSPMAWSVVTPWQWLSTTGTCERSTASMRHLRSKHHVPAVGSEGLAHVVRGLVRGEEDHRRGDLPHLAEAFNRERVLQGFILLAPRGHDPGRYRSRCHGVDQDAPRGDLASERLGEGYDPALARAVVGQLRRTYLPELGGDVDDPALPAPQHVRQRVAAAQERAAQVDAEHPVPLLDGHLLYRR